MPYVTVGDKAPSNQTGLDPALITRIPHNPNDPTLDSAVDYPNTYAELVNPTNDQMTRVMIEDEDHVLSKIDTGNNNALELNHKPQFNTTIVVSDGVLNTALTDYENGIVYFDTMPTGTVIVQYMADPNKYYGEYLQVIHDVLHCIQWLLGAGQNLNEGIKNAEIWLDSLPAEIQARLPHAVSVRAIDRDIEIRSSTDPGAPGGTQHKITLGNGEDTVIVDAEHFLVRRSIQNDSFTNIRLGDETGDFVSIAGDLDVTGVATIGHRGQSANTGIAPSAVQAFEQTGTPYTEGSLKLAVHGDVVIAGDLWVLGSTTILNVERTIQVNVFEEHLEVGENLVVQGSTRLGNDSADLLSVSGDTELTGGLTVLGAGGKSAVFDTPLVMTNGLLKGTFQVGTVDGLDASYIECIRRFLRSDFHSQAINVAPRSPIFEGTMSYLTGAGLLADTGAPSSLSTAYGTGLYYAGKFDDGDFIAMVRSGENAGAQIPVKGYDTSLKQWSLARDLPENPAAVGDQFAVFHPEFSPANYIAAGVGLSVDISSTAVDQIVGQAGGLIKKRNSTYTVSALPQSTTSYIFMTTALGVNGMNEDEPTFFWSSSPVESDQSVLVAIVTTDASNVTAVTHVTINKRYDTLWVKFDAASSGNTKQAGVDWTIPFVPGNNKRLLRPTLRLLIADDSSNAPLKTSITEIPLDPAAFYLKTVSTTQVVLATSATSPYLGATLPYWLRALISEA